MMKFRYYYYYQYHYYIIIIIIHHLQYYQHRDVAINTSTTSKFVMFSNSEGFLIT